MAAPNGSSIFPLTLPTQPIPAEFLNDAYVQLLELVAAQAAPNGQSAATALTVDDAYFTIMDETDATKQLVFSLGGMTTGKVATITATNALNATYTLPAATDTLVGRASTDTLTNKTLSGVTISSVASGVTGTFTATGATAVVVANTNVTANSVIVYTLKTVGGTPAAKPYESAITAGTGFSVKAAAGDTSVYNYTIIG